jgi:MoaA/NifB/PqqE/SkfB family radical SAM enzyme
MSMTTSGVDINKYVDELTAIRGLVEINVSFNTTSFEKLLSALRLFKKHEQQNEVYLNLACPITHWNQNRLIDIIKHFENSNVKCIAPWLVPFIQPNGDVIPCDEVNIVMGNVKYESKYIVHHKNS